MSRGETLRITFPVPLSVTPHGGINTLKEIPDFQFPVPLRFT